MTQPMTRDVAKLVESIDVTVAELSALMTVVEVWTA